MSWVIDLARQHTPADGAANLFGVIVFTDRHAHTRKMLCDEVYWSALDAWSGQKWAVFATRAAPGKWEMPKPPPGILAHMAPVWKDPKENLALLNVFDLESTENLPVLVVFVEDAKGEILSTFIEIDDSSEKAAYDSLREALKNVSDTLDFMRNENRGVDTRAFDLAAERLQRLKNWRSIKRSFAILEHLKSLAGL